MAEGSVWLLRHKELNIYKDEHHIRGELATKEKYKHRLRVCRGKKIDD